MCTIIEEFILFMLAFQLTQIEARDDIKKKTFLYQFMIEIVLTEAWLT